MIQNLTLICEAVHENIGKLLRSTQLIWWLTGTCFLFWLPFVSPRTSVFKNRHSDSCVLRKCDFQVRTIYNETLEASSKVAKRESNLIETKSITLLFMSLEWNSWACSFTCLSVCVSVANNFNPGDNFWTVGDSCHAYSTNETLSNDTMVKDIVTLTVPFTKIANLDFVETFVFHKHLCILQYFQWRRAIRGLI